MNFRWRQLTWPAAVELFWCQMGLFLTEHHLLVLGRDLAPGAGLAQRRTRQRAVAFVGDRDLDRILVHRHLVTEVGSHRVTPVLIN